jgi:transcriptional regulator with XRE-family HTH domain
VSIRIYPGHPHRALREIRDGRPVQPLAELAGLTHAAVRRWENGTAAPRLGSLVAYAAACGYDIVFTRREAP